MINPQKAIDFMRKKYPTLRLSDEKAYQWFMEQNPKFNYPEDPFKAPEKLIKPPQVKSQEEDMSTLGRLATWSPLAHFADDYEWAADAYTDSMAGTLYRAIYGKDRFDNYNPEELDHWSTDIAQFLTGMVNPIDLAALFLMKGSGKAAVQNPWVKRWLAKGGEKIITKHGGKAAIKNMSKLPKALTAVEKGFESTLRRGVVSSGASMGTYGMISGLLGDAAQQRTNIVDPRHEQKSFNYMQSVGSGVKHGVESMIVGGLAGGFTHGIMAPKFQEAVRLYKNGNNRLMNFSKAAALNPVGQVATEAALFTGGHVSLEMLESLATGEDVDLSTRRLVRDYIQNLGVIGGLRGLSASMRGIKRVAGIGKPELSPSEIYINNRKKVIKDVVLPEYRKKKISEGKVPEDMYADALNKIGEKAKEEGNIETAKFVMEEKAKELNKHQDELQLHDSGLKIKKEHERLIAKENAGEVLTDKEQAELFEYTMARSHMELDALKRTQVEKDGVMVTADWAYDAYAKAMGFDPKLLNKPILSGEFLKLTPKQVIDAEISGRIKTLEKGLEATNDISGKSEIKKQEIRAENHQVFHRQKKNGKYVVDVLDENGQKVKGLVGEGREFDTLEDVKAQRKVVTQNIKDAYTGGDKTKTGDDNNGVSNKHINKTDEVEEFKNKFNEKADKIDSQSLLEEIASYSRESIETIKSIYKKPILLKGDLPDAVDVPRLRARVEEIRKQKALEKSQLAQDIAELKTSTKPKSPFFSKKKKGTGKTVESLVNEKIKSASNLDKIRLGIQKFFGVGKKTYADMERLVDYFSWAEKQGVEIDGLTFPLLKEYMRHKGWADSDLQYKYLNDSLGSFFGGPGSKQAGFADRYMNSELVWQKGLERRGAAKTEEKKAVVYSQDIPSVKAQITNKTIEPEYVKLSDVEKLNSVPIQKMNNDGTYPLVTKSTQRTSWEMIDALLTSHIEFGSRITDLLNLKIKDINWQTGEVLGFTKGAGQKGQGTRKGLNIKNNLPELWDKLLKAKGERNFAEDFIFINNKGNQLSGDAYNSILRRYIDITGLKEVGGTKGYLQGSDIRKIVATQMNALLVEGSNVYKFVRGELIGKVKGVTSAHYDTPQMDKVWQEWISIKKEAETGKTPSQTAEENLQNVGNKKNIETLRSAGDKAATDTVHKARIDHFTEKYGENALGVEVVKAFNEAGIPADAVAYIEGNKVRILQGKAPSYATGHEYTHASFKVVDVFNKLAKQNKLPKHLNKKIYKETADLMELAKKTFVNKEGKFVEEDAVKMIDKYVEGEIVNPMKSRIRRWFKKFNMMWKRIFNIPPSKEEIAWAIGRKVASAEGIPMELQRLVKPGKEYLKMNEFASPDDFVRDISNKVKDAANAHGISVDELMPIIARSARISSPESFKLTLSHDYTGSEVKMLEDFSSRLNSLNLENIGALKNLAETMGTYDRVRILESETGFSNKEIKEIREIIGIKNNNLLSVKKKVLDAYEDGLSSMELNKNYVDEAHVMNEELTEKGAFREIEGADVKTKLRKQYGYNGVFLGDIYSYLKKIGLKKMATLLYQHNAASTNNGGVRAEFENKVRMILGGTLGRGKLKWEGGVRKKGLRDLIAHSFDHEISLEDINVWKNNKEISVSERNAIADREGFMKKVVNDAWWKQVKADKNGKYTAPKITKQYTQKEINVMKSKNLKIDTETGRNVSNIKEGDYKWLKTENGSHTIEAQIAKEYAEMMDRYDKMNKDSARPIMTETEYDAYLESSTYKTVKDNLYVSRVVTKEGKVALHITEGDVYRKNMLKIKREIAEAEANKSSAKYKKEYDRALKEKNKAEVEEILEGSERFKYNTHESPMEIAESKKVSRYNKATEFTPDNFTTGFIKTRLEKQPNFMKNTDGKYIRTYESSYMNTVTRYTRAVSLYNANVRYFPSQVKELAKDFDTKDALINKIIESSTGKETKELADYVKKIVNKQLGVAESSGALGDHYRLMDTTTRLLAKVGLSFPTTGLVKNIGTGGAGTLSTFDANYVVRGLGDVIGRDAMRENAFYKTGATEIGHAALYEAKGVVGAFEKILDRYAFRFGFMEPTEIFNRKTVIFASKYEQADLVSALQNYSKGHKHHTKAVNRLKKFYKQTDANIKLLEKYGTSEKVESFFTAKDKYQMLQTKMKLKEIEGQLNHAAHVFTQGSSADLFMPEWAGKRGWRPLTLYKRMAFAATKNTIANTKESLQAGNIIKPFLSLTATWMTGAAMLGIYSSMFGKAMPNENSSWWSRFWTTMWRGEILGILSEMWSPYDRSIGNHLQPSIIHNGTSLLTLISEQGWLPGQEKKAHLFSLNQGIDKFLSRNIALYGGLRKTWEANWDENTPMYRDMMELEQIDKDWDKFEGRGGIQVTKTAESPHWYDFKRSFYLGTSKDFARDFWLLYLSKYSSYMKIGEPNADKKAMQYIKTKLKNLNPNPHVMVNAKTKVQKENASQWLRWLKRHPRSDEIIKKAIESENAYNERFKKYVHEELLYHTRKMNLSNLAAGFDFKSIYSK